MKNFRTRNRAKDHVYKLVSILLLASVIACGGGGDVSVQTSPGLCGSSSTVNAACDTTGTGSMPPPPPPKPCGGNAADYVAGLNDEFEKPLDRKIWNDREWYNEPVSTANYEVSDGSLKLWLQHDTKTWFAEKDLSAGFHTYALKWEPNRLSYYFDGKPVHSTDVNMADAMYILLDTKPDPKSAPDDSTPTKRGNILDPGATFEVKYLRTWCFENLGCR